MLTIFIMVHMRRRAEVVCEGERSATPERLALNARSTSAGDLSASPRIITDDSLSDERCVEARA